MVASSADITPVLLKKCHSGDDPSTDGEDTRIISLASIAEGKLILPELGEAAVAIMGVYIPANNFDDFIDGAIHPK